MNGGYMKLTPVFTVKANKLYKIADNSAVDTSAFRRIEIPWSTVEIEEDSYNEEFLSLLREQLKKLDDSGDFAILVPIVDKPLQTQEQVERFINSYNHAARRVKDCVSVAGYELPSELKDVKNFMETIALKHAQYVYFSKTEKIPSDMIVLY